MILLLFGLLRLVIRHWLTYIAFYRRHMRLGLCIVIQTNLFPQTDQVRRIFDMSNLNYVDKWLSRHTIDE